MDYSIYLDHRKSAVSGCAPGKVILTGEHAVVYGYPAIAFPLHNLIARASVASASPGYGTLIAALDLQQHARMSDLTPQMQLLSQAVETTLAAAGLQEEPDWILQIRSQIPIARGLGSGAAVICALVRAVSKAAGFSLDLEAQNRIVDASEAVLHGSPSGIDGLTVIYGLPLYYQKGLAPQFFQPQHSPSFLVADTGVPIPTSLAVNKVARLRHQKPNEVEGWLRDIGEVTKAVHRVLTKASHLELGPLINANQELLRRLGVSSVANEKLIQAALEGGAFAAKVTGAGLGGQVLVLANEQECASLEETLLAAGAKAVLPVQWQMDVSNPSV